jgi:hypothetical protein
LIAEGKERETYLKEALATILTKQIICLEIGK